MKKDVQSKEVHNGQVQNPWNNHKDKDLTSDQTLNQLRQWETKLVFYFLSEQLGKLSSNERKEKLNSQSYLSGYCVGGLNVA